MGLIREPKNVDFIIQSEPWTEEELEDSRKLIKEQKAKNAKRKLKTSSKGQRSTIPKMVLPKGENHSYNPD